MAPAWPRRDPCSSRGPVGSCPSSLHRSVDHQGPWGLEPRVPSLVEAPKCSVAWDPCVPLGDLAYKAREPLRAGGGIGRLVRQGEPVLPYPFVDRCFSALSVQSLA